MFSDGNDRLKQWEEEHKKWSGIREKGKWGFVLRHALTTGVEVTIILFLAQWIQNRFSNRAEDPLYFVCFAFPTACFFGAFSGWRKWRSSERHYPIEEERRRKLRARAADDGKVVPLTSA